MFVATILVMCLVSPAMAEGKKTTITGEVAETKDGVYVDRVFIPDEIFPKGNNLRKLAGKIVEITGIVRRHEEPELPNSPPGPIVQKREGPYEYLTSIESVKIRNPSALAGSEVLLEERKMFEDCGWVVSLDSIWKDDQGKLRADLVTFRANAVSKPMSGGYAEGMTIEIGEDHCKYLVKKIDDVQRRVTFVRR